MSLEHSRPQRRRRYRRDEASAYLKENHDLDCAPKTLAKLASIGGGPVMEYAGRFPLYPEEGLDHFAESKLSGPVRSTSELRAVRRGVAA
jgi:hypothetical protein